jgi:hypothetical protein
MNFGAEELCHLLEELFARLSTSASLPAESVDGDETEPVGFPHPAE